MTLNKPLIVEMWIEFLFDQGSRHTVEQALQFLQGFADEYPTIEIAREDTLQFRQVSPTKLPEVIGRATAIEHFRVSDEAGTRWLHLTPNQLVCNFLRLGEKYPGFATLLDFTMAKLNRFVGLCKPAKIQHAAIHYVDVIDIPFPPAKEIPLADHFTLGLDLPADPFGNQLSYLLRTAVRPPDGTGLIEVQLQSETLVNSGHGLRFRMDWHKFCPYDDEVDVGRIREDLSRAHESVMKSFRAAFTERTWKLFEPTE